MAVTTSAASNKWIGSYELLETVGDGGMGTVYKACDQKTGAIVAVKIIHPEMATNPVLCRRMEHEFRAVRSLHHPNIVRGLDCDFEAAVPYFVMEFVDGESLGDLVRREGPLPENRAVRIIMHIAEAIHQAHEHHFIHRDIKPDNILLTADGEPKLTDMGLVKCLDADVNLTQGCYFLGTPNYAAPEQFDDPGLVDRRADIYSLGATLYTAITGEIPFFVNRKESQLIILKKKLMNELTPPRKLVPHLSEHIDFAIRRAMRAEKSQRHPTCVEFIAALAGTVELEEALENHRRSAEVVKNADRRASIRYGASLDSSCAPLSLLKERTWKAKILDISSHGVRMNVYRRFEPGTILNIDIESGEANSLSSHLVQIVWIRKQNGKEWSVGGAFIRELSNLEVQMLLDS